MAIESSSKASGILYPPTRSSQVPTNLVRRWFGCGRVRSSATPLYVLSQDRECKWSLQLRQRHGRGAEALRFHSRCWLDGKYPPALIALFRDIETGERAGIHRTWLTADAQKIDRRMFGRWPRPRAIKLWPADNRLVVGEGIETVLAAATQLGMRPAWALSSKIYLQKLPVISGVDELTILVDHDSDGAAAAIACDQTWRDAGRRVRLLRTKDPGLNDFNDLILKTPRAEWGSGF